MDVFLSWSGETSNRVAELLRDWLPTVIQSVNPWLSSRDIPSGQRWFEHVSNTTNTFSYGLFQNKTTPTYSYYNWCENCQFILQLNTIIGVRTVNLFYNKK